MNQKLLTLIKIFIVFLVATLLFFYFKSNTDSEKTETLINNYLVNISFGEKNGLIKPLLGVNAGPYPSGDETSVELSKQYKEIGVTSVRTHDFYGPFDMVSIYPDINADPTNPKSYNFTESDKAFSAIINNGLETYLRIGDSYNKVRIPQNEKEKNNLIKAMLEVIKRYKNRGQIEYVEIWNEPDLKKFWPEGFEKFIPFYCDAYNEIKKQFPDLKVGGPGFVTSTYKIESQRQNVSKFFNYLKERGITPDFVSFHLYSSDPFDYSNAISFYHEEASKAGFNKIELHLTEWNTEHKDENVDVILGDKTAPYLTAIWISQQQAGLNKSFIYRGNDTSTKLPTFFGIFYAEGKEKPSAKAFKLWSEITKYQNKILIDVSNYELNNLWILSGKKTSGEIGILLSNTGNEEIEYKISLPVSNEIISGKISEIYNSETSIKNFDKKELVFTLKPLSVQLIELPKL